MAGKRKARREGDRGRRPSLLLGLVYDDAGQRYTPSHTIKNAQCYRYYVAHRSQHVPGARPVRIPAHDLETLVVQRLLRWLSDKIAVLDALGAAADDAALLQALLASASARCQAWPKLAPEKVRQFVRAVVVRITVGVDLIVIALNKSALRSLLLAAASHGASAWAPEAEDDVIQLTIEAHVQRRGCAVRFVVTPAEAGGSPDSQDSPELINTLAQAHLWLEQLLRGEVTSLRAIARSVSKSERYVSQVIRAAFLAPDLVEAALQGRQPALLTLRQMRALPLDWNEQRRMFGFAHDAPPSVAIL